MNYDNQLITPRVLKQIPMYNKEVITGDATLTNKNKPTKSFKTVEGQQKNSILSHKIYHVANIKIEATW